jgi:hypothetical protein
VKRVIGPRLALLLAIASCYPATTRPDLQPVPGALRIEIELFVPQATRALAVELDADSLPVRRTEPDDGWLESEWIDARTLQATTRRPVGPDVVKIRAFVEPGRPNHSVLYVETVYRQVADPARPDRDLEVQVPVGHAIGDRVARVVERMAQEHGGLGEESH